MYIKMEKIKRLILFRKETQKVYKKIMRESI